MTQSIEGVQLSIDETRALLFITKGMVPAKTLRRKVKALLVEYITCTGRLVGAVDDIRIPRLPDTIQQDHVC